MLIKCTEVGHDVSDKAKSCPNCGCPVSEILQVPEKGIFCNINGKYEDITWIKEMIEKFSEEELNHYKYIWSQRIGTKEQIKACYEKYHSVLESHFFDEASNICAQASRKYNLKMQPAVRLLYELVETNFELDEFNGEIYETDIRDTPSNKQTFVSQVRCPYCGSFDVRRNTGFMGRHRLFVPSASIGKNWKCKSCGSYF